MRGRYSNSMPRPTMGLDNLPSSWLRQFIVSLPPQDRLSLFQTCRQLSQQVVVSSPLICLQLQGSLEWRYERTVGQLASNAYFLYLPVFILLALSSWCSSSMYCRPMPWILTVCYFLLSNLNTLVYLLAIWRRRRTSGKIVRILYGSQNLKLKLYGTVPIPRQLYRQITVLEIHDLDDSWWPGENLHRCRWEELTSLQQLTLDNVHGRTLFCLWWALQAGHLQQLLQLSFYPDGVSEAECSGYLYFTEVAVIKLGPSLTHLATNCLKLWARLRNFTALLSVEIGPGQLQPQPAKQRYSELSADVLCQLCEHPTLRTVTLRACTADDPWGQDSTAQLRCKWKTLIMDGTHPQILASVALTGLQEIRFMSGLPQCQQRDVQQLQRLLVAHGPTVSCGSEIFTLHSELSTEAFQLLHRLNGVRILRLFGPRVRLPHQSPELWALMPDCVQCLELWHVPEDIDEHFWQHMPQSINNIWLNDCTVSSEVLARLLTTAPAHVHNIRLTPKSKYELQQWEYAGLKNTAPDHVLVDLFHEG